MRPELTQYELVESYVSGSMTQSEAQDFEAQIAASPELRSMVEFQPLFTQANKRSALRAEIAAIIPTPPRKPWKGKWTIGGVFLALVTAASFFLFGNMAEKKENFEKTEQKLPVQEIQPIAVVEDTTKELAIAQPAYLPDTKCIVEPDLTLPSPPMPKVELLSTWIPLDVQHTPVQVADGAAILGDDGTLVIIPTDAFIDKNGNPVKGEIDFQLVEALKWEDMIAYNLTTERNGLALETGGMIRA
ncbi:MAG: hypothetical protein HRT72_07970, partial [Flavobacteriales bacterium]|nr:hypothetical protein [Flavobacteriales bacterium]